MDQGNQLLRSEAEEIEYTEEQMDELIRCKLDIIYFAEKYFKIVHIDKGEHVIDLYPFQKSMLKAFVEPNPDKRHLCVLASRQIGKCVSQDTKIKLRNKNTGEIMEVSIGDFYDRVR